VETRTLINILVLCSGVIDLTSYMCTHTMNNVVIDNTMTEVTFSATKVKKKQMQETSGN